MTFAPLADVDRIQVERNFNQSGEVYLSDVIPGVDIYPQRTAKVITGYRLPDIFSGLVAAELPAWRDGEQRPAAMPPSEKTVTIGQSDGFSTIPWTGSTRDSWDIRFDQLKAEGPDHLDTAKRQIDLRVAAALTNTSYFSTETWTGTGSLETQASDHTPAEDINKKLRSTGVRQRARRLRGTCKLIMIMHEDVALILASYIVYSGRGEASNEPTKQPYANLKKALMETHGVEEVHIITAQYNSGALGATGVLANIANALLWIGIVARDMTGDLRKEKSKGPDGGLAIGWASRVALDTWVPSGGERIEYGAADLDAAIITPRYTSDALEMGIFFPSTENVG